MRAFERILSYVKYNLRNLHYTTNLTVVVRTETKPLITKKLLEEIGRAGWNVLRSEWNAEGITVEVSPLEGVKPIDQMVEEMFDDLEREGDVVEPQGEGDVPASKGRKDGGIFARLRHMRSTL